MRAETIRAQTPSSPSQMLSARIVPGWAPWGVHSRATGAPTTALIAHSMCGHSAAVAEWMKISPRAF